MNTSHLHPIFQQVLAPYAPKTVRGLKRHIHTTKCGVELECWLEYEPAQSATFVDPAYPADATLVNAFHMFVDIVDLLAQDLKDAIEAEFIEAMEG